MDGDWRDQIPLTKLIALATPLSMEDLFTEEEILNMRVLRSNPQREETDEPLTTAVASLHETHEEEVSVFEVGTTQGAVGVVFVKNVAPPEDWQDKEGVIVRVLMRQMLLPRSLAERFMYELGIYPVIYVMNIYTN